MINRENNIFDDIDLSILNKIQSVENYNTLFDDVQIYNQYLNSSNNHVFNYYKSSIKEIIFYIVSIANNYNNIDQKYKDLELLQFFIFGSYKLRIPINVIYNKLYFYWKNHHFINDDILEMIEKKIIQYYHEGNDFLPSLTYVPEYDNILSEIYNYIINYKFKNNSNKSNNCIFCYNNSYINNLCICNLNFSNKPKKLIDYYFIYIILVGLFNRHWSLKKTKKFICKYFNDESWYIPECILKFCLT